GDRRAARRGGAPVRRQQSRAVAPRVGHRRAVHRVDRRPRTRRLPRRAAAAGRRARGGRPVSATRSEPIAERVARVADAAAAAGVDALLVSAPLNVRYVTGFTGSSGLALVSARPGHGAHTSGHRFITDFRYATQASPE